MHAVVTGASGFLGSRLVTRLLAQGAKVSVLARPSSRLPAWAGVNVLRAEFPAGDPSEFVAALAASAHSMTHVFHCAGCSTDWASNAAYEAGNVWSTRAMLALSASCMPRLQRFVHVSTTDVYGYPQSPCDETGAVRNVGLPYNRTKIAGETLVWDAAQTGLPVTVVRPATIYGPGSEPFIREIASMLRARIMPLIDGGCASGGFVYVDDACDGLVLAGTSLVSTGEVYNLGEVRRVTWAEYCAALAATLNLPAPRLHLPFGVAMALAGVCEFPFKLGIPGKPPLTRHATFLLGRDQGYSTLKAQQDLGWQPAIELEEGIARSAEWLRSVKAKNQG